MADWASETAGLIEKTVGNIRERTVDPAYRVTRYIVFGVMVTFGALTALTLLIFMMFRLLVVVSNLLPAPHNNAWIAWVALGGIFVAAGTFVWSKRHHSATS